MSGPLFAALMRLFPRRFREGYGATLLETLGWRAQDARSRGRLAWLVFLVRESAGLIGSAAKEHANTVSGGSLRVLVRSPLRQLRRHPLYSIACVGTIALAVGAAATSLAVLKRAFLDPLPYANDGELVSLFTRTETWENAPVSAHVVEDLRAASAPFSSYASMDPMGAAFSDGASTQSVGAIVVTPEFFETLGVRPSRGRIWTAGENDAAVVSWRFWQTSLAGDPGVIGRQITIDGANRRVVGVMGPEFVPPFWPENALFLPLDVPRLLATTNRASLPLSLIVRHADGVSAEQVDAFLAAFSMRLQNEHGSVHAAQSWHTVPLREFLVGDARPALVGMGAAAVLLLLIVGANIAGLSAARALGDRHQTAVQLALGATPGRLLRERFLDGLALSALGAGSGVWLAYLAVSWLTASQPQFLQRIAAPSLDAPAALLAFGIGVLWSALAAVLPHGASLAGRAASLTSTRGATGGTRITAMRSGLVILQVAMALVLVVGAGLLVRTLRHLADTSLGFDPAGLVTLNMSMPANRYGERATQIEFERAVLERMERIPGVMSATASVGVPVIGGGRAGVRVFGRTDEAARGEVAYMALSPDFIDEWDMRIVDGRGFEESDRLGGPGVAVLNETAAARFFPEGDALGARVRIGPDTDENEWITIVGVVADIRQHGPVQDVLPTAFISTWQYSWPTRWFTVRAASGAAHVNEEMRAAVAGVDPGAIVSTQTSIDELVANTMTGQRLVLLALGFYGLVATVLCAFGVYAVVSLTSRLRRREYAIRLAVGAHGHAVRWLVLRQALVLCGAGVLVGIGIAAGGTRLLRGLLHGVAPLDALTFTLASAGVLTLAMLSAWWPARRAASVDPAETLKE